MPKVPSTLPSWERMGLDQAARNPAATAHVSEVRPARVRKYVDGKDRFAKERGGAARSGIGADGEAIRRLPVGRRQARGGSVTQVQTILFKQENRAKHAFALGFDQQREAPQHFVQGCVEKNHLQGIQHCLAGKRRGADWRRGWPVFRDASWRFYVFHKLARCGLADAGSIAHVISRRIRIADESEVFIQGRARRFKQLNWQPACTAFSDYRSAQSTLKIEKHSSHGKTTIRLIGRFQWEHVDELKKQIQSNGKQLALDLQEVTLVDLAVVQFLALCEADGIDLLHCPPYIREWIRRERQA